MLVDSKPLSDPTMDQRDDEDLQVVADFELIDLEGRSSDEEAIDYLDGDSDMLQPVASDHPHYQHGQGVVSCSCEAVFTMDGRQLAPEQPNLEQDADSDSVLDWAVDDSPDTPDTADTPGPSEVASEVASPLRDPVAENSRSPSVQIIDLVSDNEQDEEDDDQDKALEDESGRDEGVAGLSLKMEPVDGMDHLVAFLEKSDDLEKSVEHKRRDEDQSRDDGIGLEADVDSKDSGEPISSASLPTDSDGLENVSSPEFIEFSSQQTEPESKKPADEKAGGEGKATIDHEEGEISEESQEAKQKKEEEEKDATFTLKIFEEGSEKGLSDGKDLPEGDGKQQQERSDEEIETLEMKKLRLMSELRLLGDNSQDSQGSDGATWNLVEAKTADEKVEKRNRLHREDEERRRCEEQRREEETKRFQEEEEKRCLEREEERRRWEEKYERQQREEESRRLQEEEEKRRLEEEEEKRKKREKKEQRRREKEEEKRIKERREEQFRRQMEFKRRRREEEERRSREREEEEMRRRQEELSKEQTPMSPPELDDDSTRDHIVEEPMDLESDNDGGFQTGANETNPPPTMGNVHVSPTKVANAVKLLFSSLNEAAKQLSSKRPPSRASSVSSTDSERSSPSANKKRRVGRTSPSITIKVNSAFEPATPSTSSTLDQPSTSSLLDQPSTSNRQPTMPVISESVAATTEPNKAEVPWRPPTTKWQEVSLNWLKSPSDHRSSSSNIPRPGQTLIRQASHPPVGHRSTSQRPTAVVGQPLVTPAPVPPPTSGILNTVQNDPRRNSLNYQRSLSLQDPHSHASSAISAAQHHPHHPTPNSWIEDGIKFTVHESIKGITSSFESFLSYIFMWNAQWIGRHEDNKDPIRYFKELNVWLKKTFVSHKEYVKCFIPFLMSELLFSVNKDLRERFHNTPPVVLLVKQVLLQYNVVLTCRSKPGSIKPQLQAGQLLMLDLKVLTKDPTHQQTMLSKTYFGVVEECYKDYVPIDRDDVVEVARSSRATSPALPLGRPRDWREEHVYKIVTKRSLTSVIATNEDVEIKIVADVTDVLGQAKTIFLLPNVTLADQVLTGHRTKGQRGSVEEPSPSETPATAANRDPRLRASAMMSYEPEVALHDQTEPTIQCLTVTGLAHRQQLFHRIHKFLTTPEEATSRLLIVVRNAEQACEWFNTFEPVANHNNSNNNHICLLNSPKFARSLLVSLKELACEKLIARQQDYARVKEDRSQARQVGSFVEINQDIDFYETIIQWVDARLANSFLTATATPNYYDVNNNKLRIDADIIRKWTYGRRSMVEKLDQLIASVLGHRLAHTRVVIGQHPHVVGDSVNEKALSDWLVYHPDSEQEQFQLAVVDEAHHYNEPALIGLLRYGIRTLLLAGDSADKPKTVFNKEAVERNFNFSLLHRVCM